MGEAAIDAEGGATTSARRAITAAGIGNVLEYYDFGVYGFLAGVIARKFFPGTDEVASLLATFAAFGVGFLARPLGGIVLGRLVDVRGRKSALVLTILLMAVVILGSFAPFIVTWLTQQSETPIAPTFYLIAAGLVSGATILTFRDTAFERLR